MNDDYIALWYIIGVVLIAGILNYCVAYPN